MRAHVLRHWATCRCAVRATMEKRTFLRKQRTNFQLRDKGRMYSETEGWLDLAKSTVALWVKQCCVVCMCSYAHIFLVLLAWPSLGDGLKLMDHCTLSQEPVSLRRHLPGVVRKHKSGSKLTRRCLLLIALPTLPQYFSQRLVTLLIPIQFFFITKLKDKLLSSFRNNSFPQSSMHNSLTGNQTHCKSLSTIVGVCSHKMPWWSLMGTEQEVVGSVWVLWTFRAASWSRHTDAKKNGGTGIYTIAKTYYFRQIIFVFGSSLQTLLT